MYLGIIRN